MREFIFTLVLISLQEFLEYAFLSVDLLTRISITPASIMPILVGVSS